MLKWWRACFATVLRVLLSTKPGASNFWDGPRTKGVEQLITYTLCLCLGVVLRSAQEQMPAPPSAQCVLRLLCSLPLSALVIGSQHLAIPLPKVKMKVASNVLIAQLFKCCFLEFQCVGTFIITISYFIS